MIQTKKSRYRKFKMLPLRLIEKATAEKWDLSLCYLVQLKSLHKKPIIYNFSLRAVSRQLKCSPSTLSKHIQILTEAGCLKMSGRHLLITGVSKLLSRYKSCNVPVRVGKNRKDQLNFIRLVLVKRNCDRQKDGNTLKNDIIDIHSNSNKRLSKAAYKVIRRREAKLKSAKVESFKTDYLMLSNQKFGQLCNRSKSTGARIQKELNALRVIKSELNYVKVSDEKLDRRAFNELYEGMHEYQLSKLGYVFRVMPNKVTLL